MDGVPSSTPSEERIARHERLAFERVSARLIGRRPKRVTIGRYRMERELGRGGFGAVYAAHDPELDRAVAIKLVLPEKGRGGGKWEARLVREAQMLAKLQHPNVVPVFDVGVDDGLGGSEGVYIVMELLHGQSARAWSKGDPKPAWQHVVEAFVGAARGLAAAHALDIVHRDFKPDNLMITDDGLAKVIDFGLARDVNEFDSTRSFESGDAARSGSQLTSHGTVMGTPPYMPPEQHAAVGIGSVGPASDQYALCVSLFEVLYGVRPFVADGLEALYEAKCALALSARPKATRVPKAVHRVLLRGLQPQPDKRWPSMQALADALAAAAAPRRRVVAALLAGVAAVGLSIVGARAFAEDESRCSAVKARSGEIWSPSRGESLQGQLLADARGPDAAMWLAAERRLDRRMKEWQEALDSACVARDAGRIECLDQWLSGVDVALSVAERGDTTAPVIMSLVGDVPDLAGCVSAREVVDPGLMDDIMRARALAKAGEESESLALAATVVLRARGVGDRSLEVEALLAAGFVYAERERLEDARLVLIEAAELAESEGLDAAGAQAAIILVRVCGAMGRFDDAHRWGALAQARLARLGNPPYLERLFLGALVFQQIYEGRFADAYDNGGALVELLPEESMAYERGRALANVAMSAFELGRMHEARAVSAEARALISRDVGAAHPSVARILADEGRYAAAAGDVEEGVALLQQAIVSLEIAGGPLDPYALNARRTLANYLARLGRFDESLTMLEKTHAGMTQLYGTEHVRTAMAAFALADQLVMNDRPQEAVVVAREAMTTISGLFGAADPRMAWGAELLGRALALQGKLPEARDVVTRALASLTDASPGERESRVNLTMVLAGLDQDEGRLDDSVRNLERAIELCENDAALNDPSMLASLEGARAFVEAERGQPARAVEAAERTLGFLERIGASAQEKAEYEVLIDDGGVLPRVE